MVSSSFRAPARLARRTARRALQMLRYRRLTLKGVPILFANSFPKSGTHLLTQVLQGFPSIVPAGDSGLPAVVTYIGETGRVRSTQEILADLQRLLPGDTPTGTCMPARKWLSNCAIHGTAAYFISRDPRDVVVSHVHYVTEIEMTTSTTLTILKS